MNKYKSLFSPNKEIRVDQYIIEILCKNKAESLKKSLSIGFSQLPEWKIFWSSQTKKCQFYLDKYHPDIIISVISKKKIYSLFAGWIDDEFQKEHNRILNITKNISNIETPKRIIKNKGQQKKDLNLERFDG
jgi:hypothetical protein